MLPGKTWTVLEDDDGGYNVTLPLGFGFISLLVLTAIGCGVQSFCRKNGSDDDIYSLGYGGTSSSYHRNDSLGADEAPCMNCLLIEMGEMVCYTPRCPECGRTPPGRKKPESFRKMLGRKLSVRKSVSFKSNSSNRSRDSRDRPAGAAPGDLPIGVGAAGSSSSRNQNWIMQGRMDRYPDDGHVMSGGGHIPTDNYHRSLV